MSITKRVTQLMKADVHGVLDLLEEPLSIIRQAMREMTEELERNEAEQKALEVQIQENGRTQESVALLFSELKQQVQFCINEGNDELARKVIRRKLETERRQAALAEQRTRLLQQKDILQNQMERRREQLQQVKERYEFAQTNVAAGNCALRGADNSIISDADVEIALLKEKSAVNASEHSTN